MRNDGMLSCYYSGDTRAHSQTLQTFSTACLHQPTLMHCPHGGPLLCPVFYSTSLRNAIFVTNSPSFWFEAVSVWELCKTLPGVPFCSYVQLY